jgi:hypothetical protein
LITGFFYIKELKRVKTNKLSIDIVKQLSKKGEELSWKDFEPYSGTEVGSGLYIKMYPINDKYSLLVGSAGPNEPLMYIYLIDAKDKEKRIDIRYDDIDKFINNVP